MATSQEDCPSRNTRSSQNTPPQSQEERDSHPTCLYEITIEPLVKDTVVQKNSSAKKLGIYVCGGSSWSEIKSKIFQKFCSKCVAIAERDDEGVWRSHGDGVNEANFARIFSLRVGSHVKKIESEAKMNDWLVLMRRTRLSLSVYKYGNEVVTKDQLLEFTSTCIAPQNPNRSGAPNEATIQEYIARLHSKWDTIWEADNPIWRIWASHILKPPQLAWESRVNQMPPPQVMARLRPRSSAQETRLLNFNQTIRTALDIVDGSLQELAQLRSSVDVVGQRLTLFEQGLNAKREILVAMESDLALIPESEMPHSGIVDDDNVHDEDHDFSLEDSS
ncbi:hypothetical protein AeRB84_006668 [Aphanomyces euteiches]|nr:hypothetical protein AeRB84_006668 [Aphanomyces euteiches]